MADHRNPRQLRAVENGKNGRNYLGVRFKRTPVAPTISGWAVGLRIEEDENKLSWAQAAQGAYLLRTNCQEQNPTKLWRWYIHLTEAEDAFRTNKSDLRMRPLYHHREDRVQAHIMVCFLSLAMWRTLEMWLQVKGLGNCARQVLNEIDTIRSMDVVLHVKNKAEVRLRRNAMHILSPLSPSIGLLIPKFVFIRD